MYTSAAAATEKVNKEIIVIYNEYFNKKESQGLNTNYENMKQAIYNDFKEKTISLQLKDIDKYAGIENNIFYKIINNCYQLELETLNKVIDTVIREDYLSINDDKWKLSRKANVVKKVKKVLKSMYDLLKKVYLYEENLKKTDFLEKKIEDYITSTKINEITALGADKARIRPFDFFNEARTISTPTKRYDDDKIKVIVDVILLLNEAIYDYMPSMSWGDRLVTQTGLSKKLDVSNVGIHGMGSYLGRGYAYEEIGVSKEVVTDEIGLDLLLDLKANELSKQITDIFGKPSQPPPAAPSREIENVSTEYTIENSKNINIQPKFDYQKDEKYIWTLEPSDQLKIDPVTGTITGKVNFPADKVRAKFTIIIYKKKKMGKNQELARKYFFIDKLEQQQQQQQPLGQAGTQTPTGPQPPTKPIINNVKPTYQAVDGKNITPIKPILKNPDDPTNQNKYIWSIDPKDPLTINKDNGEITGTITFTGITVEKTFTIYVKQAPFDNLIASKQFIFRKNVG